MDRIEQYFLENAEPSYGDFSFKSAHTVKREDILGVRVPKIRALAKSLNEEEKLKFINKLPHRYLEENLLHGFIIQNMKDYKLALDYLEKFLPYVDNWMVSDTITPKVFGKHPIEVRPFVMKWIKSNKTFTKRFGIATLIWLFLEEDFNKKDLDVVSNIKSDEYYVNMVVAWYFATALDKQWEETIKIIESKKLDKWVQNKSIQKAIESYRISNERKEYLKTLKK